MARRIAQALGHEAKTDALDARVLAMMGAAFDLRPVDLASPTQRDLDELQTARDALVKDRTAALNRGRHVRHTLLRRQNRNRLAQVDQQFKALDAEAASLIAGDKELSLKADSTPPSAIGSHSQRKCRRPNGDIATLEKRGYFYCALTSCTSMLTALHFPNTVPEPYASMYGPESIPPWPNFDGIFEGSSACPA